MNIFEEIERIFFGERRMAFPINDECKTFLGRSPLK